MSTSGTAAVTLTERAATTGRLSSLTKAEVRSLVRHRRPTRIPNFAIFPQLRAADAPPCAMRARLLAAPATVRASTWFTGRGDLRLPSASLIADRGQSACHAQVLVHHGMTTGRYKANGARLDPTAPRPGLKFFRVARSNFGFGRDCSASRRVSQT